jgi:hypothetical protein
MKDLEQQFEGDIALEFYMAPPLLSRRNGSRRASCASAAG